MTKIWCVGGRNKSKTNNLVEYGKVNRKTKKLGKIKSRELVIFAEEINHNFLLSN